MSGVWEVMGSSEGRLVGGKMKDGGEELWQCFRVVCCCFCHYSRYLHLLDHILKAIMSALLWLKNVYLSVGLP